MFSSAVSHLRQQWLGAVALFLVVAGGTAYAANTVFSTDIVDGQVKTSDLGALAVTSGKLADDAVTGGKVKNASLTGSDVADNSLKGADIDESSLAGIGGGSMEARRNVAPGTYVPDKCPATTATFCSGWFYQYEPSERLTFFKDASGMVHLQGQAFCFADYPPQCAYGNEIFVLPTGYRPAGQLWFDTDGTGHTRAVVEIAANGMVSLRSGDPTSHLEFSGISFRPAS